MVALVCTGSNYVAKMTTVMVAALTITAVPLARPAAAARSTAASPWAERPQAVTPVSCSWAYAIPVFVEQADPLAEEYGSSTEVSCKSYVAEIIVMNYQFCRRGRSRLPGRQRSD